MKKTRNSKAAVGFIFVTLILDVTGVGIIIPVMPSLIMELTGEGVSEAAKYGGWLVFAYAFFQFLFAPVMGSLSDQFGRRKVLLAALFGFGVDYIFLAMAPSLAWLFVGRVISGMLGASFTTAAAYIADVSPPEKRSQNFGLIGAAFGLGFIVGPVIGGLLGEYGPRIPFFAAAALTLINWLYGFFVLPESLPVEKRRTFDWKRANPVGSLMNLKRYPLIAGLIFALTFVYIASHALQSTWSYFTMYRFDWSEAEVGYSLGFVGVMSALVQGLLIRILIPKIGQERSVYIGMILYAAGLLLFGLAVDGWMLYPFMVVYCLGGIAGPAIQGIMSNEVPDNEQGELQGALTGLTSATAIIGPPLMTGLFALCSGPDAIIELPASPMILGAILVLIGLLFTQRTLQKKRSS